jgi:hypothetical protein
MANIAWESVQHEFSFDDGSWRDIYVAGVGYQDWQRVFDRLRHENYELVYHRDGEVVEFPTAAIDAFPAHDDPLSMLWVKFAGIQANCHFFTPDEIEFDIDPREIQGQGQLDALFAFLQLLADATGKPAVLTPESGQDTVIFRAQPGQPEMEYHSRSG